MRGIWSIHPGWGITAVRIAMGIIFLVAGWQKVSGGLDGLAAAFAKMGIPVPGLAGPFVAVLELVGGALLILGLGARWLGLLFAIEFVVATLYVKMPMGWGGARLDVMLLAGGLLLFLAGSGRAAVDEVWLEKGDVVGRR
ncbi:MAG: DoxX family protein [Candidatus Rokuibacteriota bacterium]